jgi:HEAT repeat protein
VIVSADHGEEFGDHGGRYHGTTVYEEQVRVPLVIVGPGVAPRVVATPVQTIDLLPTTLAALDIPMPARVRGRDLGGLLAGKPPADEGLAFAETDDWTLVARGNDRLVCERKIASCTLFDVARDPEERRAIADRPERVLELRRLGAAIERENGRLEGTPWPDALRRAMQGDRDAAEDIAPLLDDADVRIRRAAAKVAFRLRAPEIASQLARAAGKDEDREVRAWSTLATARLAPVGVPTPGAEPLVADADPDLRLAAALVLAEHGDGRGEAILVEHWTQGEGRGTARDLEEARELLGAFARIRARSATPALVRSLDDVRLRPHVVEALGAIGDPRARDPLLATFAAERYVHVRPIEARALVALGVREALRAPLARFAGVPEPMPGAIAIASGAGLLQPARGGASFEETKAAVDVTLTVTPGLPSRLIVLAAGPGTIAASLDGAPTVAAVTGAGDVAIVEIARTTAASARIHVEHPAGVRAIWLVPRAEEIPPPPPEEWDAGPL